MAATATMSMIRLQEQERMWRRVRGGISAAADGDDNGDDDGSGGVGEGDAEEAVEAAASKNDHTEEKYAWS